MGFTGAYLLLSVGGIVDQLREPQGLQEMLLSLGFWGPLSVVALMTLAVVLSPLPSAPIALAAGALYGHTLGTLYVLAGAELGALIAAGAIQVKSGPLCPTGVSLVAQIAVRDSVLNGEHPR